MKPIFKLIFNLSVVATLLTSTLTLSGCGLKGPLYYPPSSDFTTVTAQLFLLDKTV